MGITNRKILIWLNSLNISNRVINVLLQNFKSLETFWNVENNEILNITNIRDSVKSRLIKYRTEEYLEGYIATVDEDEIMISTILDENYPEKLKNMPDPPNVLYLRGKEYRDCPTIAIVGSRKSTDYGKWACKKFVGELVNLDIGIISGVALGIDKIAHISALENDGYTIGVLGNGLNEIYPKANKKLYEDIIENGTLISEFPPNSQPKAYNFPKRNRIISALSDGVIVIEAQEKSGSIITAHHALDQGKDVFALPGNINSLYSKGTNRLIKDGARPLLDIDDILEELYGLEGYGLKPKKNILDYSIYSKSEIKILKALENGPASPDKLVYETGMNISNITTILIGLELKNVIETSSNGVFILS